MHRAFPVTSCSGTLDATGFDIHLSSGPKVAIGQCFAGLGPENPSRSLHLVGISKSLHKSRMAKSTVIRLPVSPIQGLLYLSVVLPVFVETSFYMIICTTRRLDESSL
jgi:hypothetical protein